MAALERRRLGRPVATDSAETRKRLVKEAWRLFAIHGFDGATNRAVADAVGITPGAIYHYFPSKVELYVAAYREVQTLVADAMESALVAAPDLGGRISALLDALGEVIASEPSLLGFVVGVAAESQQHPELSAAIQRERTRTADVLARMCSEAVERDEVDDDVDAETLQDVLNAILSGMARFAHVIDDPERQRRLREGLKAAFVGRLVRAPLTT